MEKYVEFIKSKRKILVVIVLLINILAIIGLFRIRINTDFNIFTINDSPKKEEYTAMNETFPASEDILVMLEFQEDNITSENINTFLDFVDYLNSDENISYVNSSIPEEIPVKQSFVSLRDEENVSSEMLNNYFKTLGELSPIIYENDHTYTTVSVFPSEKFDYKDINKIEEYLEENNITYYLSGDTYLQNKIVDYIKYILYFLPPMALILILLVFRTQMKSFKATFFSVLPAGLGALWTMGIIGWLGKEVSVITVLAPIFTIVIGSADGLHFVSHIQENLSQGKNKIESIIATLKIVGIPMIITTLTSMVGFLSLIVLKNDAIKELAIFASLGIMLAGLATWYVIPVILSGNVKIASSNKKDEMKKNTLKKLWGIPSVLIVIVLVVISLFNFSKIKNEFNMLMIYKDSTEVSQSFNKIMEVNKGATPIFVVLETEENPMKPEYGERVLQFEEDLKETQYTDKVISLYDLYSNIYKISFETENMYPENTGQLEKVSMFSENISEDTISNFINEDKNTTRLMVFPKDLSNNTLEQLDDYVKTFNDENEDMKATITGAQYLMYELNSSIIEGQTKSTIIAMILIFLLLLLSLKKVKTAVVAILPIIITAFILNGFLGISAISLNLITVTIFSVTLGVGVDYAIHFTSVWNSYINEGDTPEEATDKAYKYTSKPVIANAIGLSIGFSALLLSPLKIHTYISALMWVSMLVSVLLSLSFLPTMLRRLNIRK
ncbi:efflux RND transporter permease subunit [Clostridium sp. DL1XJH146]